MNSFINEDFLLKGVTAKKLYSEYAKDMPIYDYHNHLSAKEIYDDKNFSSITELWLGGDHYKWRAMRWFGKNENDITGTATDDVKFKEWADTLYHSIGNPLYHWSYLELLRYFNISDPLNKDNADEIRGKIDNMLKNNEAEYSVRTLIKKSNVKVLCTTDDPLDSLEYHIKIKEDESIDTLVLPSFRPDTAINIERYTFVNWIRELAELQGAEINTYDKLKNALISRIDFFHNVGCRISDHGLEPVTYRKANNLNVDDIFKKSLAGTKLTDEEVASYKSDILLFLGREYSKRDWTMQLHIGVLRNNNTRLYNKVGVNTGFDSIGDDIFAEKLVAFLDDLDSSNELPKTIIYGINPRDNYVTGTIAGSFQTGQIKGKVQLGTGWWFNDQKDGMEEVIKTLANLGMLSTFVGMLTDSRSFLSFTRHEYFRRILCNIIGQWADDGELFYDIEHLGKIVQDICYNNAVDYFGIK